MREISFSENPFLDVSQSGQQLQATIDLAMLARGCVPYQAPPHPDDLRPDLRRNAAILGRPHEPSFSSDALRPGFLCPGEWRHMQARGAGKYETEMV